MNHSCFLLRVMGIIFVVLGSTNTFAQVSISYTPTTLDPDVTTDITISLTNNTGSDFGIGAIVIQFEVPTGLTLSDARWLSGLDDAGNFLIGTTIPSNVQVLIDGATGSVPIADGETLAICRFSVLADATLAGTQSTLVVFPDGPNSAIAEDIDFLEYEVDSGRSVTFTITGQSDDSGSGGDSGDKSGGGGDGGGQPGQGDDSGGAGNDSGEITDGDGSGGAMDDGMGSGGVGSDDGGSGGDDSGEVVSDDGGSTPPADGGGNGDGGVNDGNGSNGDGAGSVDNGGDDENGDSPNVGTGGRPAGPCGVGMIQVGVFSLCFMSVMKLHGKRRWICR